MGDSDECVCISSAPVVGDVTRETRKRRACRNEGCETTRVGNTSGVCDAHASNKVRRESTLMSREGERD